jgi:hypothetical protein
MPVPDLGRVRQALLLRVRFCLQKLLIRRKAATCPKFFGCRIFGIVHCSWMATYVMLVG